jgi:hypothetical protein
MRDPHVASLRYRLVPGETVSFDCLPPVERETEAFRMRLDDDVATFELKEHHANEETAKRAADAFLQNWEIYACLRLGPGAVRFVFERADMVDRHPLRQQRGRVFMRQTRTASAKAYIVRAGQPRASYPQPPDDFKASADVEAMWFHYQQFRSGRERLVDMANTCLTLLDERGGTRRGAAKTYRIEYDVLHELGRLISTVGDYRSARKLKGITEPRPHTGAEKAWIESAVKALIRRAGEWAYDPEARLPLITMSDLPKL